MSIEYVLEVTSRGDGFKRFLKDGDTNVYITATRTFLAKLDGKRDFEDSQKLLPQVNDAHPDCPTIYVTNVSHEVSKEDVNIYQVTVTYEGMEDDDNEPYPWKEPAEVTFNTDSSITEVNELAYNTWEYAPSDTDINHILAGHKMTPNDRFPERQRVPIVVEPIKEKLSSLPAEPVLTRRMAITFNYKGFKGNANAPIGGPLEGPQKPKPGFGHGKIESWYLAHDRTILEKFFKDVYTVNASEQPVRVFGIDIPPYHGYFTNVEIKDKFFKDAKMRNLPYYEISIVIDINPRTWIRPMLNRSLNRLVKNDEDEETVEHIQVLNVSKGELENITEPMNIHPQSGAVIGLKSNGTIDFESLKAYTPYYVPYLTKKPSDWATITTLLNEVYFRSGGGDVD